MQVRKQQLELDMEQQTGSKGKEKEYVKAVYCHPAYLTYMQSTSGETLGWRKHKLESRLLGEISITSEMQINYSTCMKLLGHVSILFTHKEKHLSKYWLNLWHVHHCIATGFLSSHCQNLKPLQLKLNT